MVVCASAAGQFVIPMLIFKRKKANPDLGVGAPPDWSVEISDTGYINTNLFVTWLQNCIKTVKPTRDNKVLLVLDGHTTHSKNIEAIELARNNGVVILQLPEHTTHRLQPLDVAAFKPLELYYTEANEKWLRSHPGLTVSQYQVAQLLGEAYARAAVMAYAMNGFRKSGIWPVDRKVFTDVDFIPANIVSTNQSVNPDSNFESRNILDSDDDEPLIRHVKRFSTESKTGVDELITEDHNVASTSKDAHKVTIEQVLKSPVVDQSKAKKSRGIQKAEVITSSPYKDELQAKQSPAPNKKRRKVQLGSTVSKKKRTNEKEWYCKLCNECAIEDMIQCLKFRTWVHETCANVE